MIIVSSVIFLSSCNKDNSTSSELTDQQFIQSVILNGYSSTSFDEDNVMSRDTTDLNDGSAVSDDGTMMSPIDSLKRWGRIITGVNVNYNINPSGDTMFTVNLTRTITGNYRIIGYYNLGQIDSVNKPYTEVFYRNIVFKRVARTNYPRLNWRLYKVSCLDGETTQPQTGSSLVQINKVEVYKNSSGTPSYTFNGPNFQDSTIFTTRYFGGAGIPYVQRGDQVKILVYTTSQETDPDYVSWHWARNSFGFHRQKFELLSQSGNQRVYQKTFNIYSNHGMGCFNGYISASTHESLYDDDISKFASDEVGIPYWVF